MTPANIVAARARVAQIAKGMLSGDIDLIVGARELCDLRHTIGESENQVFLPIIGFESDTDDYPIGDLRRRYEPAQLQQIDKEIAAYVQQAKPGVLAACRRILETLGP